MRDLLLQLSAFLSQLSSFLIALVFAIILWAVATSEENPSREAFLPDPLPVEIVNRPSNLAIFDKSAETVRAKVRAPLPLWDQMRAESFHVFLDLKGADAGLFQAEPRVQPNDPRISIVSVEPPVISVRLDRLVAREIQVETELADSLPTGFVNKPPKTNPERVQMSGPAALVEQIAQVDADISLRGVKSTIEKSVPLVARDARGNAIAGVTITPSEVFVTVPIEQRVGFKDVSIKTVLKGNVAAGYWISNIVVTPSTATAVGSADALAKVPGFIETAPIDVNTATSDVIKSIPLQLPEGVSILDNNGVTVQIAITPILGGQTIRRAVTAQGLRRGLAASFSPDTVEIILSGPLPSLASLSEQDVQVVIDAAGLGAGSYVLKPRVIILPSTLKVQSLLPDSILVVIVEANPK